MLAKDVELDLELKQIKVYGAPGETVTFTAGSEMNRAPGKNATNMDKKNHTF